MLFLGIISWKGASRFNEVWQASFLSGGKGGEGVHFLLKIDGEIMKPMKSSIFYLYSKIILDIH